jgi:hypothetical protein
MSNARVRKKDVLPSGHTQPQQQRQQQQQQQQYIHVTIMTSSERVLFTGNTI